TLVLDDPNKGQDHDKGSRNQGRYIVPVIIGAIALLFLIFFLFYPRPASADKETPYVAASPTFGDSETENAIEYGEVDNIGTGTTVHGDVPNEMENTPVAKSSAPVSQQGDSGLDHDFYSLLEEALDASNPPNVRTRLMNPMGLYLA